MGESQSASRQTTVVACRNRFPWWCAFLLFSAFLLPTGGATAGILADHTAVSKCALVPDSVLNQIRASFRIYYGHTSHGSQVITGLDMLQTDDPSRYTKPTFSEYGDDLGQYGDTTWVPPTRNFLNANPTYNVVMWSWCGGVSDNTEEGINAYLNAMSQLELEYPNVKFVYMTGHLDGSGISGNLYLRNNQIRAYCAANNKILFDFADIESYDPDGNYYPNASDDCAWCSLWCSTHSCPGCPSCAHSHCFNCYLKGKAWWWMAARMSGWSSGPPVCGDANRDGSVDVSDAVFLVSYIFAGGAAPNPLSLGDANCDGTVDISDAVYLIAYIFSGGPAPCVGC